jgi:hypothetical protein
MRAVPTILGVIAAFLLGAALAVAVRPQPLFREIVAYLKGDSAIERCIKAGACNAAKGPQDVPAPRLRQEAPADMDRA